MPQKAPPHAFKPGNTFGQGRKSRAKMLQEQLDRLGGSIAEREAQLRARRPDGQIDAHSLLALVYNAQELPLPVRTDAAKAALPFEKPKLSAAAIDLRGTEHLADRMRKALRRASGGLEAEGVLIEAQLIQDGADAALAHAAAVTMTEAVADAEDEDAALVREMLE